jgi:hypothetical protein
MDDDIIGPRNVPDDFEWPDCLEGDRRRNNGVCRDSATPWDCTHLNVCTNKTLLDGFDALYGDAGVDAIAWHWAELAARGEPLHPAYGWAKAWCERAARFEPSDPAGDFARQQCAYARLLPPPDPRWQRKNDATDED